MDIVKTSLLTVRILDNMQEAHAVWASLSHELSKTVYQTPEFLNSWLEIIGTGEGVNPIFISIKDQEDGQLLLPLGIKKAAGLKIAQFFGGKHANFNMPIFNDGALKWSDKQIKTAMVKAGNMAGIDIFSLVNQPINWYGIVNPLAQLRSQPSPSYGYSLVLQKNPDELISARLSKDGRKKLRHKEKSVAKLGDIQFVEALDADQHNNMLQAYFSQKSVQFKAKGIKDPFNDENVRKWFSNLSCLRLFGLELNGKYLAIWGIGIQGQHVSGMFTSYDTTSDAARSSPGEVLLVWLIRKLCLDGYSSVDFGVGEARYKDIWCDKTVELVDAYVDVSLMGIIPAFILRLKGRVKRWVKQSTFVLNTIRTLKSKLKFR